MKVSVDHDICCSYGLCIETVPEVFSFGDDNQLVIASDVPKDLESKVRFACESCPAQALTAED